MTRYGAQPGRRMRDGPERRLKILDVMRTEPGRAWTASDVYMHASLWREMTRSQLTTALGILRRDGLIEVASKGSRETASTWTLTEQGRQP